MIFFLFIFFIFCVCVIKEKKLDSDVGPDLTESWEAFLQCDKALLQAPTTLPASFSILAKHCFLGWEGDGIDAFKINV